jgi:hypothetical protein
MTISSYKLTNGVLLLGTAPLDVSAQVTSIKLTPSETVETTDAIPVLSGDEIPEEEEADYTYVLEGTFLQDLAVAGIIEYSWNNKGQWRDFVFVPNNTVDRGVQGQVRITPLAVGGDITRPANRPTSDFTWKARGVDVSTPDPIFGVYDAVNDEIDEDV